MDRNEMIEIIKTMSERCLLKGIITTLNEAEILCSSFNRFINKKYINDDEYSKDILYFYNLATKLHDSGNTSLGESYSIYAAILAADRVDFVETNNDIIKENNNIKELTKSNRSKKT